MQERLAAKSEARRQNHTPSTGTVLTSTTVTSNRTAEPPSAKLTSIPVIPRAVKRKHEVTSKSGNPAHVETDVELDMAFDLEAAEHAMLAKKPHKRASLAEHAEFTSGLPQFEVSESALDRDREQVRLLEQKLGTCVCIMTTTS